MIYLKIALFIIVLIFILFSFFKFYQRYKSSLNCSNENDDKKNNHLGRKIYEDICKKSNNIKIDNDIFSSDNILLDVEADDRISALKIVGDLLYKLNYVEHEYINSLLKKDNEISVYMDVGIAVPHVEKKYRSLIKKNGIVFLRCKNGVDFDNEKAHMIIGICGIGDMHLDLFSKIGRIVDDEKKYNILRYSKSKKAILDVFYS